MEINNLVDKEFKVMVIKKLAELGRRMDEHSENFKKEMGNIRNCQIEATELKHTITELNWTIQSMKFSRPECWNG